MVFILDHFEVRRDFVFSRIKRVEMRAVLLLGAFLAFLGDHMHDLFSNFCILFGLIRFRGICRDCGVDFVHFGDDKVLTGEYISGNSFVSHYCDFVNFACIACHKAVAELPKLVAAPAKNFATGIESNTEAVAYRYPVELCLMLRHEQLWRKGVACAPEAPDKDLSIVVDCTRVTASRN